MRSQQSIRRALLNCLPSAVVFLAMMAAAVACAAAEPPATSAHQVSEPSPPSLRLLWHDDRPAEATFVPEVILRSTPTSELPMTEQLRRGLEAALHRRRSQPPSADSKGCSPGGDANRHGHSPWAVDLISTIVRNDATVVATVEELVQGWGWHYGGASTVVYARVRQVLRDTSGSLEIGGEISYERQGADFPVQGVRLCKDPRPGMHQPAPGGTLLISGYVSSVNPGLLYANTVLAVEQGALVPEPLDNITGRVDWEVRALEVELATREVPQ